jgi:hypothetical protein
MGYLNELEKARRLLQEKDYNLCSMQCGRILEGLLKDLLTSYYGKVDASVRDSIGKQLSRVNKSIERLTFGEISSIFRKTIATHELSRCFKIDRKEYELIKLESLVFIRNKAQHGGNEDSEEKAGADAYIMFGSVLKLLHCFSLITKDNQQQQIDEKPESLPIGATPVSHKTKSQSSPKRLIGLPEDTIEVCSNKNNGRFFIYIGELAGNKYKLVTPVGEIKTLEQHLFNQVEERKTKESIEKGVITQKQHSVYKTYERSEEEIQKSPKVSMPQQSYEYRVNDAIAWLKIVDSSFVVLKGSTAVKDIKKSCPDGAVKKREELLNSGILFFNPKSDLYEFQHDVPFKSPSAASGFISGTSTNGWVCFGIKKLDNL